MSCRHRPTVTELTGCPRRSSCSAIARVDLLVHFKRLIGSPAVVSSMIRTSSRRSSGSKSSTFFLPAPGLRIRPSVLAGNRPFARSSAAPFMIVGRDTPVSRDISLITPRPRLRASSAASNQTDCARPLTAIRDMTDRTSAEQELHGSEVRFREIAERIREVFWVTDPAKTRMIYVSPAYEEIWGRTCASLYENPMSFVEAIHSDDREGVLARMARQASGEYDEVYRILRPDGSLRWIHDRAFPVHGPGGELARIVGSAHDITELKQT